MVIEYINSKWTIPKRLAALAVLFIIPSAIQLGAYVNQQLSAIRITEIEEVGAEYGKELWQFTGKIVSGQPGEISPQFQKSISEKPEFREVARQFGELATAQTETERMLKATKLFSQIADDTGMTFDPDTVTFFGQDLLMQKLPKLQLSLHELARAYRDGREPPVIIDSATRLDLRLEDAITVMAQVEMHAGASGEGAFFKSSAELLKRQAAAILQDLKNAGHQHGMLGKDFGAKLGQLTESSLGLARKTEEFFIRTSDARVANNWSKLIWSFGALSGLTLLAAALAYFMSRGLSSKLDDLVAAMERITRKELSVHVPHTGDTNENGKIARALEVFRAGVEENTAMAKAALASADEQQAQSAHYEREHEIFMGAFTSAADRIAQGDFSHRIIEKVIPEYEMIIEQMNLMMGRLESANREKVEAEANIHIAVDALGSSLAELAGGNLEVEIEQEVASEFSKLKSDFNSAVSELRNTISQVKKGAESIKVGTDEISQASDDLSRRTENQAASLEETAAAVKEITVTVNRAAEGATHARETVSVAKADAEKSGEVVRRAIEAMNAIDNSSKQISQIIGVIDEIAFQTNLLALNAGVEAARAGDAGRGFAVVASEVRALAQRSADAAKEIKGLISASTTQVAQGVRLVGETGESLGRIVVQVGAINDVVSNIAISANEQAHGLGQVNTAVNEMDQVTQQNAAMVEQATAATQALSRQTEELARLVSRFRTGDSNVTDLKSRKEQSRSNGTHAPKHSKAKMKVGASGGYQQRQAVNSDAGWEEF